MTVVSHQLVWLSSGFICFRHHCDQRSRVQTKIFFFYLGIFQPHVRHLLVLATPVDIVILGLHCSNIQSGNSLLSPYSQLCITWQCVNSLVYLHIAVLLVVMQKN